MRTISIIILAKIIVYLYQKSIQFLASIGAMLAIVISWQNNQSILWAMWHGFIGWFYVLYFFKYWYIFGALSIICLYWIVNSIIELKKTIQDTFRLQKEFEEKKKRMKEIEDLFTKN